MSTIGWILIFITAGLAVIANSLLRIGVDRAGGFASEIGKLHESLLNLVKQPHFDFGILMYALATIAWVRILATEPLGLAYPILVSITFMLVTLASVILFKESISAHKIIGILIIIAGIALVSQN